MPRRKHRRELVGVGARRRVYAIGSNSVVKVPKNVFGLRSNAKEDILYRTSPYRIRKYLGKVRRFEHQWIVMKRYRRKFPRSSIYLRRLSRLKSLFYKHHIIPYEIYSSRTGDANRQNLRLDRRGRIIVIDYGNFKDMRGL